MGFLPAIFLRHSGGRVIFDGNGIITLEEGYHYVSTKVPQATGQDQHPVKKGEMTGQIVLGVVK